MIKILYMLLAVVLISGCATYTPWEWEAGKLWSNKSSMKCSRRVAILADKMKKAGEKFQIVKGKPSYLAPEFPKFPNIAEPRKGHVWIEQDGKVLDPTNAGNPRTDYKVYEIIYVNQGNEMQDQEAQEFIDKFKDGLN